MACLIIPFSRPVASHPYRGRGNRGKVPTVPFYSVSGIAGKSHNLTIGVRFIC